jgi:hypothetical protein
MNTRPVYDPTQTIFTESQDSQGTLTAHIITNVPALSPRSPQDEHPDLLCYYDTLDELIAAVKEHYGQPAQYVDRITFLTKMAQRGMSSSWLES